MPDMANSMKKQHANAPPRQIPHTRLYDDAGLETKYEVLGKLGEGSFGTVSRVKSKENDLFYAMKTIPKKPGNRSKASSLDNEVKLLTEVNHANLIQLHEVLESSQKLYLIVELCEGGELGDCLKKIGPLPEETVKQIMSKLINALHYLHKMNIVHRDLKLENILLKNSPTNKTDEFDIRVTDFGLSSKQSIISTDSLFNDHCGTPLYMAPEILENKNYSALCDVWALGVIMYYLISGRHPYVANEEHRLLETIRSCKLRYDSEKFQSVSTEGLDFMQGMLVYDTVHRRTMGELIAHPWLTGRSDVGPAKDIITMMKEFQAENDQRQPGEENTATSARETQEANNLVAATTDAPKSSSTSVNKDSEMAKNDKSLSKANSIAYDLQSTSDRSKFGPKPTGRLTYDALKTFRGTTHDFNGNLSKRYLRSKLSDTGTDSITSNYSRQSFNAPSLLSSSTTMTRLRQGRVRLGRSQSQADLALSKNSSYRQQRLQRTVPTGNIDVTMASASNNGAPSSGDSTAQIESKSPPSSTATALMMINKHFSADPAPSVSLMSNSHHQRENTNKNTLV